jgi:polyisoprenyl-teichoic acid--peptidoglycan teichoic acid transferase
VFLKKISLNWRKIVLVSVLFLVAGMVFLMVVLGTVGSTAVRYMTLSGIKREWISEFIKSEKKEIRQDEGKTNFLILGYHQEGKQNGDEMTDTIVVLSYDQGTGEAKMISVPRDIWDQDMQSKVNTAYHYGGLGMAKEVIGKVIEEPIHYSLAIDFNGFSAVVNTVGGVTVEIPETFDDYEFPIPGKEADLCGDEVYVEGKFYECRYQHVHFDQGLTYLDGERALQYVRSRKAWGDEGTDFARSRRQQQVIEAIVKKVTDKKFLGSPENMANLLSIYTNFTKTDMEKSDYFDLLNFAFQNYSKLLKTEVKKVFLDQEVNEEGQLILYHPSYHYSGQWVLLKR